MHRLVQASTSEIRQVGSWIKTSKDCVLWSGPSLSFPIDLDNLPEVIGGEGIESYVLYDEDDLVGFGQLVNKDQDRVHLARIIVLPIRRGKGIGRLLVGCLLNRCREKRYGRISLNVVKSNEVAFKLYTSLGFAVSEKPTSDTDSPDAYYMELQRNKSVQGTSADNGH